jgi:hypothetical protein
MAISDLTRIGGGIIEQAFNASTGKMHLVRVVSGAITEDLGEIKTGVDAELQVGDVEIGAVEIKDHTNDDRARVEADAAALRVVPGSGLPAEFQTDAAGADAYATVLTTPNRVCHYLIFQLDPGNDAILSLDGGTTDHFFVTANQIYALDGLNIPAGSVIQAKNAVGGSNYTNLRISVW